MSKDKTRLEIDAIMFQICKLSKKCKPDKINQILQLLSELQNDLDDTPTKTSIKSKPTTSLDYSKTFEIMVKDTKEKQEAKEKQVSSQHDALKAANYALEKLKDIS